MDHEECDFCGQDFHPGQLREIRNSDGTISMQCDDCVEEHELLAEQDAKLARWNASHKP